MITFYSDEESRLTAKSAHGNEIEIHFDDNGAWDWAYVDALEYLPNHPGLKGHFFAFGTWPNLTWISLADICSQAEDHYEDVQREDRAEMKAWEAHVRCCQRGLL